MQVVLLLCQPKAVGRESETFLPSRRIISDEERRRHPMEGKPLKKGLPKPRKGVRLK
jgi:hypothetical protein